MERRMASTRMRREVRTKQCATFSGMSISFNVATSPVRAASPTATCQRRTP
jgi:hypothetical protein